jgi:helicase
MIDRVENDLLPQRESWADVLDPLDTDFVTTMLTWAWSQRTVQISVREVYRLKENVIPDSVKESFFTFVRMWLAGNSFNDVAIASGQSVDDLLGIYTRTIAFELQTLIEQSIALLRKLVEQQEKLLAPAVEQFPEHLRYGVPTNAAKVLAANGLRHRRAVVVLGISDPLREDVSDNKAIVFIGAEQELLSDENKYRDLLGTLVFEHTKIDLDSVTRSYREP